MTKCRLAKQFNRRLYTGNSYAKGKNCEPAKKKLRFRSLYSFIAEITYFFFPCAFYNGS
jgi:hypothetical protein